MESRYKKISNFHGLRNPVLSSETSRWGTEKGFLLSWKTYHSKSLRAKKWESLEGQEPVSHQLYRQCLEYVNRKWALITFLENMMVKKWAFIPWDNTFQWFLRLHSFSVDLSVKTLTLSTWGLMRKYGRPWKTLIWPNQCDQYIFVNSDGKET